MTGFLPRLFSRLRRREPAWIEPGGLKRLLDAGDVPLVLDVRGRDEFVGPLGTFRERRTFRCPAYPRASPS